MLIILCISKYCEAMDKIIVYNQITILTISDKTEFILDYPLELKGGAY